MSAFETTLKEAIRNTIGDVIASEVQDLVAKETRRALREREDDLAAIVRGAVVAAVADMLKEPPTP